MLTLKRDALCMVYIIILCTPTVVTDNSTEHRVSCSRHYVYDKCAYERSKKLKYNCECDRNCTFYGDCCIDAPFKKSHLKVRPECVSVPGLNFYALLDCSPRWRKKETRQKCQTKGATGLDTMVYSKSTGLFYGNIFCAICSFDSSDLVGFHFDSSCKCPRYNESKDYDYSEPKRPTCRQRSLFLQFKSYKRALRCYNFPTDLQQFNEKFRVRTCTTATKTCPEGSNEPYTLRCERYTSYVYGKTAYKNVDCAKCNGETQGLNCQRAKRTKEKRGVRTVLYFSIGNGRLALRFLKRCISGSNKMKHKNIDCLTLGWRITPRNCYYVSRLNITILNSSLVYDHTTNEYSTLNLVEYVWLKKSMHICNTSKNPLLPKPSSSVTWIVHSAFLTVSIFCIVIRLMMYIANDCSSHFSKLQALFTTSLLAAHVCYAVSSVTEAESTNLLCFGTAVTMHYFYLASFLWKNIIWHDIWSILCTMNPSPRGRYRLIYSNIYGWGIPFLIVSAAVAMDVFVNESKYQPMYGLSACWISDYNGIKVFFLLPVLLSTAVNSVWYIVVAGYLWKAKRLQRELRIESDTINLCVYLQLTLAMGAAWLLLYVSTFRGLEGLSRAFFVVNGIQGILLFFALKRRNTRIIARLRNLYRVRF